MARIKKNVRMVLWRLVPIVTVVFALSAPLSPAADKGPKTPAGDLHQLDLSKITIDVGTGGKDPMGLIPSDLLGAGTPKPFYPPFGNFYNKGYYFTGPGKVLPEAALRIDRREQLCEVRSEVRKEKYVDKYWDGPRDCSAAAWMVRDEKGLTVRVRVTDDKFVSADAKTNFNNDSVELCFDLRAEDKGRGTFAYHPGVFQITLVPTKSGKVIVAFTKDNQKVPGVTAGCRFFEGGYQVKCFVPFEGLKVNHVAAGNEFNFSVSVNDSDTPGDRDTQMVWSGDHMNFMDARRFGRMTSIRRGYYFTTGDKPPAGALLVAKTSFHVRGKPLAKGGTWDGPKDCSAAAWLRRDAGGLTVHVDVTDDKVDTSSPQQWMRDRVALYFDFRKGDQLGKSHFDRGVMELTFPVPQAGGKVEVYSNGAQRRRTPIPGTRAT